jgi:transcriptional regulator with XRE-family HTH domain
VKPTSRPRGTARGGSRLRAWRQSAGFTLSEVAGLCGLSEATVSRVERGERGLSPENKVRMARCLGVAVSELFPAQDINGPQV